MLFKRSILTALLPLLLIGMLVAACGNSSTTTGYSSAPTEAPTATSAPTEAPTATTAPSSGAIVKTASATVQGKAVTILTNAQGLTLYYFTSDTPTTSACTGGCASNWPPLLFTGSGAPTSATSLPGNLTVSNNANGAQVEYQGHPLYTFAGDSAPGQTNGEGIGGKWYVATTDLKAVGNGY